MLHCSEDEAGRHQADFCLMAMRDVFIVVSVVQDELYLNLNAHD